MGQYKFNSMEKAADGFHEVLTLDWFPGAIGRFFGHKKQTYRFYGNCTVWHAYPDFERCSTSMELILSGFWTYGENMRAEAKDREPGRLKDEDKSSIGLDL